MSEGGCDDGHAIIEFYESSLLGLICMLFLIAGQKKLSINNNYQYYKFEVRENQHVNHPIK